jgi:hypothetical protein
MYPQRSVGGKIMKTCIQCANMYLFTKAYSELTPGEDVKIGCHKYHWAFDAHGTTITEFRVMMGTAETCPDFIDYNQPSKIIESIKPWEIRATKLAHENRLVKKCKFCNCEGSGSIDKPNIKQSKCLDPYCVCHRHVMKRQ